MDDCCTVQPAGVKGRLQCLECGRPGRLVHTITVKAMLGPEGLARLSAGEYRFCATPQCPVVYFGADEAFERGEVVVPTFQKEPAGNRTVCYCFAVSEGDIKRELVKTGRSTASERITALVKADRCACELKNPQGSCCLGNVAAVTKALSAELSLVAPAEEETCAP